MILFVDQLINVDFSYLDPQRGLVGETWIANVELAGALDQQGMICDFGLVKKKIRAWLDKNVDHCLLVPTQSGNLRLKDLAPNDQIREKQDQTVSLSWRFHGKQLEIESPSPAVCRIPTKRISPENVAHWCVEQLSPEFPQSITQFKLGFVTENIAAPYYHYSHGLKKHQGNCQRIAHGHRSKIEIWIDDQLAPEEMQYWANTLKDIYIASQEDQVNSGPEYLQFAYQAQQGDFKLQLPPEHVYFIETDSTVEHIARHIAEKLKQKYAHHSVTVKAYEGLGKGAIVAL